MFLPTLIALLIKSFKEGLPFLNKLLYYIPGVLLSSAAATTASLSLSADIVFYHKLTICTYLLLSHDILLKKPKLRLTDNNSQFPSSPLEKRKITVLNILGWGAKSRIQSPRGEHYLLRSLTF